MTVRLAVPQSDGEIRLTIAGDGPYIYPVTDGHVEVEPERLHTFLAHVPGSGEPAPANPVPPVGDGSTPVIADQVTAGKPVDTAKKG